MTRRLRSGPCCPHLPTDFLGRERERDEKLIDFFEEKAALQATL